MESLLNYRPLGSTPEILAQERKTCHFSLEYLGNKKMVGQRHMYQSSSFPSSSQKEKINWNNSESTGRSYVPKLAFRDFWRSVPETCANIVHSSPNKRAEQQGKTDRAFVGTFKLPMASSGPYGTTPWWTAGCGPGWGCDRDVVFHNHQNQRRDHAGLWEMNDNPHRASAQWKQQTTVHQSDFSPECQ